MSIATLFRRLLGDFEHAAEAVVHFAEKEFTMNLPQAFTDAIARIQALLSSHSDQNAADAQTISDLKAANTDLQSKLDAANASVADLTSQLSDATAQIADMEAAVLNIAPAA